MLALYHQETQSDARRRLLSNSSGYSAILGVSFVQVCRTGKSEKTQRLRLRHHRLGPSCVNFIFFTIFHKIGIQPVAPGSGSGQDQAKARLERGIRLGSEQNQAQARIRTRPGSGSGQNQDQARIRYRPGSGADQDQIKARIRFRPESGSGQDHVQARIRLRLRIRFKPE